MRIGWRDGEHDGCPEGFVGLEVGFALGPDGFIVGCPVGEVGRVDGCMLGSETGREEGCLEGFVLGF